jgi:hypothetical protein
MPAQGCGLEGIDPHVPWSEILQIDEGELAAWQVRGAMAHS